MNVAKLIAVFGGPQAEGWGSGVFTGTVSGGDEAQAIALNVYHQFLGAKYTPERAAAWAAGWKSVGAWTTEPVLASLAGVQDVAAHISMPLLIEAGDGSVDVNQALTDAFDQPDRTDLNLYCIGDGDALSGLLLLARFASGTWVALVAMMD